ncbi:mobilization protein [Chryseobacterium echinoideorum]|uniref:mobilization protein n=1 Tax=Chryseobacterium echinoideorum TaxID=1549648 RepID=UPI0011863704|nr:mobilization protein [Chryseobacterium echinoideorum]
MNLKYFEYIVIYLSVLLVCVVAGTLARLSFLHKGGDEYTANIVFWSITAFSVLIYGIIILFLDVILVGIKKFIQKRKNSKNNVIKSVPANNLDEKIEEQEVVINDNSSIHFNEDSQENNLAQTSALVNLESIRKVQLEEKEQIENQKLQIAIDYTRNQFALYVTDENLAEICKLITLYSKQEEIPHQTSVVTKELSNLDLYHFGWNIWNHFKPIKQEKVSKLLKTVFVSLDDIDVDTIKSHLKDEPKKGIIKIQENLTNQ